MKYLGQNLMLLYSIHMREAILASVLLTLPLSSCKSPQRDHSALESEVVLNKKIINLETYRATELDFKGMKKEFDSMARENDGRPNYLDAVSFLEKSDGFYDIIDEDLTEEEKVALLIWSVGETDDDMAPYRIINKALRSPSAHDDRQIDSTVRTLASAVNKLKGVECKGVRGVASLPDNILKLKAKQKYFDHGFMPITEGEKLVKPFDKMPIILKVSSPICKRISVFSKFPKEKEVLFPPGADFEVVSNKKVDGQTVMVLKHIPPQ